MARPRKSRRHEFYDLFNDFDLADQAIVIEFLIEQHRQNQRAAAKLSRAPRPKSEHVDAMRAGADGSATPSAGAGHAPSFSAHPRDKLAASAEDERDAADSAAGVK